MRQNARLAYLETEILQADPVELVRLLYRGALEAVAKARQHVRENNIRARSQQITKASEILNELATSVDVEKGGAIAGNLLELYDYMQRLLIEANFQQVEGPLVELESLLATVLEGWEAIRVESEPPTGYNRPDCDSPILTGSSSYSTLS